MKMKTKMDAEVIDYAEAIRRARENEARPVPEYEVALADQPQGFLAQVFVPQGHPRYDKLVEQTQFEHRIWWGFGESSDGRQGLWVNKLMLDGEVLPDPTRGLTKVRKP